MLGKSQPNFYHYVKKIEAQAKNGFLIKTCIQVKSIKNWNNVIEEIHFTLEDFMKCSEVINKKKKNTDM